MLQKNQTVTLAIEELNNLGFGVGRVAGEVVFVSGAVDGDTVLARIIRPHAKYAIAKVEEIITPSPHRAMSPCSSRGCGACAYLAVSEEHEADLKVATVKTAFQKAGMADVAIEPLLKTGERYRYRNKAQYPVAQDKNGNLQIGFYAPRSHRVVPAIDCPLGDASFPPILHTLHAFFTKHRTSAYDEETGKGLLRHIYLRRGTVSGEILLTLVINGKSLPHATELVATLRAAHPDIVGILLNINQENTNVICGEEYIPLWGKSTLHDTLAGVPLEIAPGAFYQVNHDAAELLYHRARTLANLRGEELLLDLFCGAGSIGLSMAEHVREVVGIEIVPEAVECAKRNAAAMGATNASFYCGDAENTENLLGVAEAERGAPLRPDVVVLDPPRRGCGGALLAYIARLSPRRVVYISCNPETLARDAACLTQNGYRMHAITPVDLFPCTGHVECVTCFTRENVKHQMKLRPEPFAMIKRGEKTIELRLWDEKRQMIEVGDGIVFENTVTGETLQTTVLHLHRFGSFAELYQALPLTQCGYTAETAEAANAADMEQYYSAEEQAKYGVVGIELLVKPAPAP